MNPAHHPLLEECDDPPDDSSPPRRRDHSAPFDPEFAPVAEAPAVAMPPWSAETLVSNRQALTQGMPDEEPVA
ncbi:hypothetical protein [Streptomyces sp. T028]|uniref:hypothetical protein n=1 Tax=Streptomyces sp. T028 TaxID=3394379 RepID=UPI003A8A4A85